VELTEAAAQLGYDAVLVRSPAYYGKQVSATAVLHYFRCVADRSPLPVLLYNIPAFVPFQIPIEMVAELAQHPNIIGIKDSSGSVEHIRSLVEATHAAPRRTVTVTPVFDAVTARMLVPKADSNGAFITADGLASGAARAVLAPTSAIKTRTKEVGFQVLAGSSSALLESLDAGASGAILGFAACAPQACQEVYSAWKEHDLKLATEKQKRIAAPSQRIVDELGLNGVKCACDFNGYYGGRARAPLLPLTAVEKAEIERLLAEIRN
jgi:dihydrodipicolinate synthase/N-acetylneuraminate lyase